MQQAGEVGAGGHADAGEGLFNGASATHARTAFNYKNPLAGTRELGSANKPVMACADHNRVPGLRGEIANGQGQPDFPERFGCG